MIELLTKFSCLILPGSARVSHQVQLSNITDLRKSCSPSSAVLYYLVQQEFVTKFSYRILPSSARVLSKFTMLSLNLLSQANLSASAVRTWIIIKCEDESDSVTRLVHIFWFLQKTLYGPFTQSFASDRFREDYTTFLVYVDTRLP